MGAPIGKVQLYSERGNLIKSWDISPWPYAKRIFEQTSNCYDCKFMDEDTKNTVIIKGGIIVYEGKDR